VVIVFADEQEEAPTIVGAFDKTLAERVSGVARRFCVSQSKQCRG
jgi:type III secretion system FlhB-like substrate exporter